MKFLIILFTISLISCDTANMNTVKLKSSTGTANFDLQGHRGCRGLMPENTVPAMLKAIDLGVTTLEMDAVITKDKQVILSHDPFLSHNITNKPDGSFVSEDEEKSLNMFQMTYNEVMKYDVGLKVHTKFIKQQKIAAVKPRLADVIDTVEAYCKERKLQLPFYNIETKTKPSTDNIFHPAPAEFVDLLMTVVKQKEITERVIIQSFDVRTLQYLHEKYPAMKTALLVEDRASFEKHLNELGFTPTIYSPYHLLVTRHLIEACKSKGIKVIPWTVNTTRTMQKLKEMGVDGLITDYPDLKPLTPKGE